MGKKAEKTNKNENHGYCIVEFGTRGENMKI